MKFLTVLLLFIRPLSSSGQSVSRLKQLLAAKDAAAFENYVDSVHRHFRPKAETYLFVRSALKRDVCPSFQEVIVDLDEIVYWKDPINGHGPNYYRINLIARDSQFVYCNFEKQISGSARDENGEREIIDSFRNNKLIDSLQTSFLRTYGATLNWKELFIDTNIYGNWCGIAVHKPEMREELDALVEEKNYQVLNDWLRSANVEKQVYAIDGLYQLKRKGLKLSSEQSKLIDIIKNKRGKLKTCSGCLYEDSWINLTVGYIINGRNH